MKLELESLGSLENQTSAIQVLNSNFEAIQDALELTFSRDGTSPNYLETDIDANSYRVYNLPAPQSGSDAARFVDITTTLAIQGVTAIPGFAGNEDKVLTNDGSVLIWKDPLQIDGLGDLKSNNNLSELTNKATARLNLELGSAAGRNVGNSGNSVPLLSGTNNWSGVQTFSGANLTGAFNYRLTNTPALLAADSVGFRGAPTEILDIDGYTFVMADAGKAKIHTTPTTVFYIIPSNANVALPVGTTILVVNIGAGIINIGKQGGVELRRAGVGTDGDIQLAQWGLCTLYKYATDAWMAAGTGVS